MATSDVRQRYQRNCHVNSFNNRRSQTRDPFHDPVFPRAMDFDRPETKDTNLAVRKRVDGSHPQSSIGDEPRVRFKIFTNPSGAQTEDVAFTMPSSDAPTPQPGTDYAIFRGSNASSVKNRVDLSTMGSDNEVNGGNDWTVNVHGLQAVNLACVSIRIVRIDFGQLRPQGKPSISSLMRASL